MDVLHEKALGLYRLYLLVVGMPECVNEYLKTQDFDFVKVKQNGIFNDYMLDVGLLSAKMMLSDINFQAKQEA